MSNEWVHSDAAVRFRRDHFTRREVLQGAAACAACDLPARRTQPVFSTDVKVVNVLATVRNKTGSLVGNLSQDDFSLSEDGRPQTIRYFARESDLPLTLGLMVDTSGSQVKVLDAERGASLRFLDQVVRENKDHVFIMQFDSSVQYAPATHLLGRQIRRCAGLRGHGDHAPVAHAGRRRHAALRRRGPGVAMRS